MKIDRKQLQEKLRILEFGVLAKSNLAYQTALKWDNDVLSTSTGFNSVQTSIDTNFIDELKALIPFKLFKQIIDKLTTQTIDLDVEENKLKIQAGRSKFSLNVMNFDTVPSLTFEEGEASIIDYSIIKNIAEKVALCCGVDNKRPIIKAVNFQSVDGVLKATATNGLKLAQLIIPSDLQLNINIDRTDIVNIAKIFNEKDTIKLVTLSEDNCYFTNGITYYAPTRMEGTYPDVTRLIPSQTKNVKIKRENFLQALDRISVLCGLTKDTSYPVVRLNFTNNSLTINNEISQIGQAVEELECITETELKLACNANNLINALKTFTAEDVYINLTQNNRPFTITSDNENNDNLTQLILPIKIEE